MFVFPYAGSSDSRVAFIRGAIELLYIWLFLAGLNISGDHRMHSTSVLDHNFRSIVFIICSECCVLSESFINTRIDGNRVCSQKRNSWDSSSCCFAHHRPHSLLYRYCICSSPSLWAKLRAYRGPATSYRPLYWLVGEHQRGRGCGIKGHAIFCLFSQPLSWLNVAHVCWNILLW